MLAPRINPNRKVTWQKPFLIVDDFLENIDDFRAQLWDHGGFSHASANLSVPDVGPAHDWRQVFSPDDFPKDFREAIASHQSLPSTDAAISFNANCLFSDMKVETRRSRASYYPHSDWHGSGELPIVFNLWLHDGEGGTGFYTYDDHATQSSMSPELRHFVENHIDGTAERLDLALPTQDYNSDFRGNEEWKLWHVAEMKKNRAFVYCGDLWHRVLIPKGKFLSPDARYSFVAFSRGGSPRFLAESGTEAFLAPRAR